MWPKPFIVVLVNCIVPPRDNCSSKLLRRNNCLFATIITTVNADILSGKRRRRRQAKTFHVFQCCENAKMTIVFLQCQHSLIFLPTVVALTASKLRLKRHTLLNKLRG